MNTHSSFLYVILLFKIVSKIKLINVINAS